MDGEIIKDEWDFYSILNFMKENFVQILLLILVFVIIYLVDHISNINSAIFGLPSTIPGITSSQPQKKIKISKKNKK
jgi:hypothetical protein